MTTELSRRRAKWRRDPKPPNVLAHGAIEVNAPRHYVYLAFDRCGRLLYVGRTGELVARLGAHASRAPWWALASVIRWEAFASRDQAARRESDLIRDLEPPHNVIRPGAPITAAEVAFAEDMVRARLHPMTGRPMTPRQLAAYRERRPDLFGAD